MKDGIILGKRPVRLDHIRETRSGKIGVSEKRTGIMERVNVQRYTM